jgi:hypothetical protein
MRNAEKVQVCLHRKLTVGTGSLLPGTACRLVALMAKRRGARGESFFRRVSTILGLGQKTLDCGAFIRKVRKDPMEIRQTQYFCGACTQIHGS